MLACVLLQENANAPTAAAQRKATSVINAISHSHSASLSLKASHVTDAHVERLCAALHSNRTITHVDLSDNKIEDTGAAALATMMLRNTSITRIDLDGNSISRLFGSGVASRKAIDVACEVRVFFVFFNDTTCFVSKGVLTKFARSFVHQFRAMHSE